MIECHYGLAKLKFVYWINGWIRRYLGNSTFFYQFLLMPLQFSPGSFSCAIWRSYCMLILLILIFVYAVGWQVWPYEESDEYGLVQGLFGMMRSLFARNTEFLTFGKSSLVAEVDFCPCLNFSHADWVH